MAARTGPTVSEALTAYLSPRRRDPNGVVTESSFAALLRDARGATRRDDNGHLPPADAGDGRSWLGALGYLCLIDQIGSAVRPTRTTKIPTKHIQPPAFRRCLDRFAGELVPTSADRDTLYALRCALAHDYSLINVGGDGRVRNPSTAQRTRAFTYTCDAFTPLITDASTAWRRSTWSPRREHATLINLYELGNLAEAIVQHVRELHGARRLRINDEYVRSPRELAVRYGLTYYDPTA